MKAGDLVCESASFPETRGELIDFLCEVIEAVLGVDNTDRLDSNGHVADTLLRFLDITVTTDEQINRLKEFLETYTYIHANFTNCWKINT
jgi:hypothetical protein